MEMGEPLRLTDFPAKVTSGSLSGHCPTLAHRCLLTFTLPVSRGLAPDRPCFQYGGECGRGPRLQPQSLVKDGPGVGSHWAAAPVRPHPWPLVLDKPLVSLVPCVCRQEGPQSFAVARTYSCESLEVSGSVLLS